MAQDDRDETPRHYDVVVVGAGSGNMVITDDFAHLRVALVEPGRFGGTCVNVGCIPSKMYVHPADVAAEIDDGRRVGIDARLVDTDWASIRSRVIEQVDSIEIDGRTGREDTDWIDVYRGTAIFVEPRVLDVTNLHHAPEASDRHEPATVRISADQVVIATGGRPTVPDIDGLGPVDGTTVHTSDTIMRVEQQPARLAVLGGGYIGAEFAHVFASLGTDVTIIDPGDRLLSTQDRDIAARFTREVQDRWDVRLGAELVRVEHSDTGLVLHLHPAEGATDAEASTVTVDTLLIATGRVPNTDVLDVAACGIDVDSKGLIRVDENQATNVPGVWALGDICDTAPLKHVANQEAKAVSHNVLHPDDLHQARHDVVPQAVFSHPQVASVGMTEDEARRDNSNVVTFTQDYADTAYGWALADDGHFCKLVADSSTGLLLGAHIIGPQAPTLIQPLIMAMSTRLTATKQPRLSTGSTPPRPRSWNRLCSASASNASHRRNLDYRCSGSALARVARSLRRPHRFLPNRTSF